MDRVFDLIQNASTSQKLIAAITLVALTNGVIYSLKAPTVEPKPKDLQERLRQLFPAFKKYPRWAFFENAGGSQVPESVIENIKNYFEFNYVQLGAGYSIANQSDLLMQECRELEETLMNSKGVGKVILGPSTSVLVEQLANAYTSVIKPEHEIIVSDAAHEANKGPWTKLAARTGATVKVWPVNTQTWETCPLESLLAILSPNTKIVAFPHVSNILGEVVNVKQIVTAIKALYPSVVICVDGVAYAPHAAMDVKDWAVDWYVYSMYKVFGPHMAAMFGRFDSFNGLVGPNHYFIASDDVPYKFELGGICHELVAGRVGLKPYFLELAGQSDANFTRKTVENAYAVIEQLELDMTKAVYDFLLTWPDVVLYSSSGLKKRVPTISFTHKFISSPEIVEHLHEDFIACRNGHMYAHSLVCKTMGLGNEGVVRLSLLHYNTKVEIERLFKSLTVLFSK